MSFKKCGWIYIVGLIMTFTQVACVSAGKHEELQAQHKKTQEQLAQLQTDKQAAEQKVGELETLVAELERKLGTASDDKESLRASILQMKEALNEASKRKREAEKRISEYSNLVSKFKSLTDAGQLSVKIVDGRMVVALPTDVLFRSGSSSLSDGGESTIKQVAQLLVTIEDKKYQIEGHTDNVPIRTKAYPSNWELASARAINVLKMMEEAGMPAERISAASYGETRPVASNETAEGKEANRRIEIVVVPDLSTLPGYEELQMYSTDVAQGSESAGS